jgi:hypothetical protein
MTLSSPRRVLVLVLSAAVLGACGSSTGSSPGQTAAPTDAPTPTIGASSPSAPAPSDPSGTPSPPDSPRPVAWRAVDVEGEEPAAREDHTWTIDPATGSAWLFGGRDGSTAFDDLWRFDARADRWERVQPGGPSPAARFGHTGTWVAGTGLVVWSGQAGTSFFADLWAYDPGANRWRELPAAGAVPPARYGSCAALGPDGRLWISHGFTEDGTRFFDTRAYDFATERWSDETPAGRTPVARCLHGCFFADDGRFVLYAGQTTGVAALGDLWALDGAGTGSASWTQVEGPRPRDRNLYAFARIDGGWLVVGGRGAGGRALGDVHLVDAASLAVSPIRARGPRPPGRAGATLIPSTGGVFMFGGTDGRSAFRDLWRLELPASR